MGPQARARNDVGAGMRDPGPYDDVRYDNAITARASAQASGLQLQEL
jgi:hypothetical protein